jgi:hypothetical protein
MKESGKYVDLNEKFCRGAQGGTTENEENMRVKKQLKITVS